MSVAAIAFAAALLAQETPASVSTTVAPIAATVVAPVETVVPPAKDPVVVAQEGIARAMQSDKSVWRAYFAMVDDGAQSGTPAYVLAPIFDGKYPQEAISAAWKAFYDAMPNAKLNLMLVPKRDASRTFGTQKPIYRRE
jgi:hypothetical protein